MSKLAIDNWSEKYGEVVWAKYDSYQWWPSFIYDPDKLPTNCVEDVKINAFKHLSKKYVVYFYGDTNYGFISLKNIKPYNETTKAQFSKQVIKKKSYQVSFLHAINLADREVVLEKHDRVSWHYVAPKDEVITTIEANHEESRVIVRKLKKQKNNRNDPTKEITEVLSDNLYFCEENVKYKVDKSHIQDDDELDETKVTNIDDSYEVSYL